MRIMIAGLAALTALAFATPSFAQDSQPSPAPVTKPKPGTKAYCNTLKSSTSRNACLKKLQASTTNKNKKTKTKAKTVKKQDPVPETSMAPQAAPTPAYSSQPVAIPPLPEKTI